MKHKRILWLAAVPVMALLLLAAIFTWTQPAAAEPAGTLGGMVSGTVTSPRGYPLPAGTVVRLFEPGSESAFGEAVPDLNDGTFLLGPVPNGLYVLKAVPPESSGLTQSEFVPVSVYNAPVDVGEVPLTEPQVFGTVVAPDGSTPAPASVTVYLADGQPIQVVDAPGGAFSLGGLPAGTYGVQAFPWGTQPYFRSVIQSFTVSEGVTQSITVTLRAADLWGVALDPDNNPIRGAKVVAADRFGHHQVALSDGNGFWTLGGLPAGDYWLSALPPLKNSGLLPPIPVSATIPGADNPYTLTFRASPKVVEGMVSTNTGAPVENALVVANRMDRGGRVTALSQADGSYAMRLGSGLWALTVRPISTTVPADWVYPDPPQFVRFRHDNAPQTETLDFTVLTADSGAYGTVQMPDGSTPPFTVTVALYNNEGIGRGTQIDPADGTFTLTLPSGGYKVAVHAADGNYLAPVFDPVRLPPDSTLDMGVITLLPRDARITGTLTVSATGAPVEGVPVVAWRPGAPGSLHAVSGPGGLYSLAVTSGTWQVRPAPTSAQPYLYLGEASEVTLASGETVSDVDFTLVGTDAVISGVLVDESGAPVTEAEGWAAAIQIGHPRIHNGAPIREGAFSINVPAGDYRVAVLLPAGSGYLSTGERSVSVASGETAAITVTVRAADARISGALVDPRDLGQPVTDLPGVVAAWNEGSWDVSPVDTGNGTFSLDVAAGLWRVTYRINSQNYARLSRGKNVPVESGQTAVIGLPVTLKDARIEGSVLDPDGNPLAGAQVVARGFSGAVDGLWIRATSRADGSFVLKVPHGRYTLGAALPGSTWIKPVETVVDVPPGGVSAGHTLQFRESDAVLHGSLTVTPTMAQGKVYVFAWSDDGGFVHGLFPVTQTVSGGSAEGTYALGVLSGTTWHAGAVFQTGTKYWKARADIFVDAADETLDLTLTGPHAKAAPVVACFDASEPRYITLSDGTEIYIPGGALPVSGTVTLRVVPIATLPSQHSARIVRYGYAFLATGPDGEPIEEHFNQDVVIRFGYDEADLHGFPEGRIRPAYYSTTTDEWTYPESYVVDTDANTVTMQIDHFTDFALTTDGTSFIFIPLLTR